jgi:hypothetical protein
MAICVWCQREMTTGISCVVDAFHRDGRRFAMKPVSGARCGDCGVARGGWHHPGCDHQRCPECGDQLMWCGCLFDEDDGGPGDLVVEPLGVDGNGLLTERVWVAEQEVIVHRDDYPESDMTTIQGIRCTNALRTVIDMAPEVSAEDLEHMLYDVLTRGFFTVEEAWRRLAEPDMADRRGAELLRRILPTSP